MMNRKVSALTSLDRDGEWAAKAHYFGMIVIIIISVADLESPLI